MAVGGLQGAQQAAALSGLRGVNAQTRSFGEGISQTLQTSEQPANTQASGQANLNSSGASSVATPADTTRVSAATSADGSRGSQLNILV